MKTAKMEHDGDSIEDDLLPEYSFDRKKARPNRFAAALRDGHEVRISVILDPDVAAVFASSESVNAALRVLIQASKSLLKV